MVRIRVDLSEPEAPISATISPRASSRSTAQRALRRPSNDLLTPPTWTAICERSLLAVRPPCQVAPMTVA